MKRLLASLLAFTLAAGLLTSCGNSKPAAASTAAQATSETAQSQPQEEEEDDYEGYALDPLTGKDTDYRGSRPVAVMLQNGYDALPQWGVSEAEVMIEVLTNGDTTSLMCVYPNVETLPKVGPVAQAEDPFLQLTLPINAIPVHIGATVYASNLLNLLTYQDLNGTYIGTTVFDIDKERYNAGTNDELCWYTESQLVQNGLDYYDASAQGELTALFRFADEDLDAANDNGKSVILHYSDNCEVGLHYNENNDLYYRDNGNGETMVDAANGEAVGFENVFVLYASSGCKDNYYLRDYDMEQGTGLYLAHGGYQQMVWQKGSATAKLKLYDLSGNELQVSPGTSYIGIYGGVGSQSVQVKDADGDERDLPDDPEPMDSYDTYIEACDTVKAQSDAINERLAAEAAAAQPAEEAPAEEAPAEEAPAEE